MLSGAEFLLISGMWPLALIVFVVSVLIPVAVLIAIMLALGRFNRDSELTAIYACGVGNARILRPLLLFAALLAVLLAIPVLAVGYAWGLPLLFGAARQVGPLLPPVFFRLEAMTSSSTW